MSESSAVEGLPKYSFHFILKKYDSNSQEFQGRYYVTAVPLNGSPPKYNPRVPGDLLFNLSGVLGNKDGKFDWGTSFFEKTISGKPRIESDHDKTEAKNVRCVLKAKLLNLRGQPVDPEAKIDLHDYLTVKKYELDGVTYHRLTARSGRPSTGRTLVLCFDGTSNQFSDKNTNVVKLAELLKKDDPNMQMIYYQTGVGTYSPRGWLTPVGVAVSSALDEGVAWYLYQHIIDGYKFLMQTYRAGDKIALFGFSRGAFTARALAGMLHCVGLLPAHNSEHVAFAYHIYRSVAKGCENPKVRREKLAEKKKGKLFEWLSPDKVDPDDFKKAFSVPVVIDFVGVWDTVASVGALRLRQFRWIEYNPSILVFRQALALDERRGNFIPSLWDHRSTDPNFQDAREVWFRGEHCDVGGGSAGPVDKSADDVKMFNTASVLQKARQVLQYSTTAPREHMPSSVQPKEGRKDKKPDVDYTMLSNISLRWMLRQMLQFNTGILLDPVAVREYQVNGVLETPLVNGMAPDLGELGPPPPRKSEDLDKEDVKKDVYESIGWSLLWNGLEHLGFTQKLMKFMSPADPKRKLFKPKLITTTTRCPNAKVGRSVYYGNKKYPIYIHKSAVDYMADLDEEHPEKPYTPRATWHGYPDGQYPPIEGAPPNSEFPANARLRVKTVEQQGKDKWAPWGKFIGRCVLVTAVGLLVASSIPKSWRVMLPASIKSLIRSWF